MIKTWLNRLLKLGVSLFFIGIILGLYATTIEPNRLIINEQTIKLNRWDATLNGFKIVAISDIHGGSTFTDEAKLQKIVEMANAQNPDIIVLLGDYVSQSEGKQNKALKMSVETMTENLRGFNSKYGVYGVIGNHDWWYDEAKVRQSFENIGVKMLENESAEIDVNGKKVQIIGIEDFWKQKTNNSSQTDALIKNDFVIGITHNPDTFDFTTNKLSLLLAGHTHGGQVWLPIIQSPIAVAQRKYTVGYINADDRHLFVTKGVGTSGPAIRFCATPEIAVITLFAK